MVYLIDDRYLFTGDTIWFGADGGYSFIAMLAESNKLSVQGLEKLESNLRARNRKIAVITGHTGWSDDLDFVFAHRDQLCSRLHKRVPDPDARMTDMTKRMIRRRKPERSCWQKRSELPVYRWNLMI